jgi:hypothetical protein
MTSWPRASDQVDLHPAYAAADFETRPYLRRVDCPVPVWGRAKL